MVGVPASTPPEGAPPAHAPRRHRSRRTLWVLAAVAIAGSVVAAGWVLWGPSAPGSAVPFSEARSLASGYLSHASSGNWSLLLAVGVDQRQSGTVNSTQLLARAGVSNCTLAPFAGAPVPASLSAPAYSGNFSGGIAPVWVLLYHELSPSTYVALSVEGPSASPIATVEGSGCLGTLAGFSPIAVGFIDSPGAAAHGWLDTYAVNDYDAMTMAATGGGTFNGFPLSDVWLIEYSGCAPFSSGPAQTNVSVAFDEFSGTSGSYLVGGAFTTSCAA